MASQDMNLSPLRAGWTELTKIFLNHSGPLTCPQPYLLIASAAPASDCQPERHTAQDGQVLQGLEHVELRAPIDIHEPQHSYKDRRHENQLNQIVTLPRQKTTRSQ